MYGESAHRNRRRHGCHRGEHPPGLGDGDGDGVGARCPAVVGIMASGAQPEQDERDAHHEVAAHHEGIVGIQPVRRVVESLRQAECQDEHTYHLHDGGNPEQHIIVAVGGCVPGEVEPRPRDREDGEQVRTDSGGRVPVRYCRGQFLRRRAERDDVGQVVEQLERCDRTRAAAGNQPRERPQAVAQLPPEIGGKFVHALRHDHPPRLPLPVQHIALHHQQAVTHTPGTKLVGLRTNVLTDAR